MRHDAPLLAAAERLWEALEAQNHIEQGADLTSVEHTGRHRFRPSTQPMVAVAGPKAASRTAELEVSAPELSALGCDDIVILQLRERKDAWRAEFMIAPARGSQQASTAARVRMTLHRGEGRKPITMQLGGSENGEFKYSQVVTVPEYEVGEEAAWTLEVEVLPA